MIYIDLSKNESVYNVNFKIYIYFFYNLEYSNLYTIADNNNPFPEFEEDEKDVVKTLPNQFRFFENKL